MLSETRTPQNHRMQRVRTITKTGRYYYRALLLAEAAVIPLGTGMSLITTCRLSLRLKSYKALRLKSYKRIRPLADAPSSAPCHSQSISCKRAGTKRDPSY